jgi:DNA-binding Lrp family transcriptional regulator
MTSRAVEKAQGKRNNGHYTASEIEAQALRALELKVRGWSDIAIGEQLGLSRLTVSKRIKHAVATHGAPTVAEYRELGKQRYEALIRTALEKGKDNPLEAVRVAGDLNAKLMKLVGAEAPVRAEVEVTMVTEQEKQLRDLLAQAERDEKVRESTLIEGEVVDA